MARVDATPNYADAPSRAWPHANKALALLRVAVGLLFIGHGGQKLFGWFGGMGPQGGTVNLTSMMGVAGMLEFFGGLMILAGFLTRPVAFVPTSKSSPARQRRCCWPAT